VKLAWRCGCGAEFPEDGTGCYGRLMRHRQDVKKEHGEECPRHQNHLTPNGRRAAAVLVDLDTDEVVAVSRQDAVNKGFIKNPAGSSQKKLRSGEVVKTRKGVRYVVYEPDRLLDESLHVLYGVYRAAHPQYQEPFDVWLLDVVLAFFVQDADELGVAPLMVEAVQLYRGEQHEHDGAV